MAAKIDAQNCKISSNSWIRSRCSRDGDGNGDGDGDGGQVDFTTVAEHNDVSQTQQWTMTYSTTKKWKKTVGSARATDAVKSQGLSTNNPGATVINVFR